MDVAFRVLGVERVDHLRHPQHPEGGHVQRLRVASLEEARAVRPRDQADLGRQRTDVLRPPAVESHALRDHARAHDLLLEVLPGRRDLARADRERLRAPHVEQMHLHLVLDLTKRIAAFLLVGHDRGLEPLLRERSDDLEGVRAVERPGLERLRLHVGPRDELELELDQLVDRALGGLEALRDDVLGRRRAATGLQQLSRCCPAPRPRSSGCRPARHRCGDRRRRCRTSPRRRPGTSG